MQIKTQIQMEIQIQEYSNTDRDTNKGPKQIKAEQNIAH